MTTLTEFAAVAHRIWPLDAAETWDTPGVTVGLGDWPVRRVLIAVDAVAATVDEAIAGEYDLLLTHHPLLLRGVTTVSGEHYKGELITRLIQQQCGLISAHTNADVVESGATSVIANALNLQQQAVISPTAEGVGIGRVGELVEPMPLGALARLLSELLPSTAGGIRGAGDWNAPVRRIAICSGAGDSLLSHPLVQGADVYITADLRHHPAQEAREAHGPALLDVSHWASEWLWCDSAAIELRAALPELQFEVSELRTDPWDFAVLPAERTS